MGKCPALLNLAYTRHAEVTRTRQHPDLVGYVARPEAGRHKRRDCPGRVFVTAHGRCEDTSQEFPFELRDDFIWPAPDVFQSAAAWSKREAAFMNRNSWEFDGFPASVGAGRHEAVPGRVRAIRLVDRVCIT